jgi:gamma-glutamylcyclotransferase (GGCT)/AIG2-like uncharacterized protein YtfP
MFDAPDGQVFGEVMTFPDIEKTLERLDRLEGYRPGDTGSHYIRVEKTMTILNSGNVAPAWVYVYPKDRLRPDFIPVPFGCWRKTIKYAILIYKRPVKTHSSTVEILGPDEVKCPPSESKGGCRWAVLKPISSAAG